MEDTTQQSRWWFGTLNNPETPLEEYLSQFKATYAVGQPEVGQTLTPHYQFCLNFKSPKRLSALKKICKKAHFEVVKSTEAAVKYCQKDETRAGNIVEIGEKPFQRNEKKDWNRALELAKQGKIDEIPADIQIRYYKNLKQIYSDNIPKQEETKETKGIWIYGKSGCGKSSTARKLFPDAYIKSQNKWWDGYKGEKYVILDDLDLQGACLGHHLKTWADHYPCNLEVKGSSTQSQYIKFIVTSQYLIDTIFEGKQLQEALKRRFLIVKPTGPFGELVEITDFSPSQM